MGRKVLLGLGVVAAFLALGAASVAFWVLDVRASAPSLDELQPIDRGEASKVFAADGSLLGYIQADSIREPVDLDEIPKTMQQASVAIEDENFYEHDGVDFLAILRAAIENVEAGEVRQGGSTITQQLVRNLYIADPEDTIERKIIEATLAEELEEERSKRWILEEYLNTASYGTNNGRTAVGVEAAAQVYFNKHISELDLDEAALMAGLPQAPSQYNPFQSEEQAIDRRNQVLRAMRREGYISREEYQRASSDGLGLERGYRYETIRYRYVFDYVEQRLIEEYGVNRVRQGGLDVHTTIDPQLQELADQAVANGAARLGGPSAALVSTDVDTGNIVAMASSENYETSKYNLAAQGQRQPGSAFKTFVLAAAVSQGIDPQSTYYSGASPVSLQLEYETWTVNNSSEASEGTLSIADATTHSTNVVYAQLDLDVGPENVTETAKAMGITSPLESVPAEGIGGLGVGVSPLEMSNAYGTLASGGVHHPATAISRVEFPGGELDETEDADGRRVLSDGEAYEVTDVLKTVLDSGTAAGQDIACPAAGKTGTTDEQADAWFVGYTPELSTAVWVGYPNARISMGSSAFGGTYAAPIWNEFMSSATSACEDFPAPENPADLSPFFGEHTSSKSSTSTSDDTTTTTPAAPVAPATTTPTTTAPDGLSGPADAYNTDEIQPPSDTDDGGPPAEPPGQTGDGPGNGN